MKKALVLGCVIVAYGFLAAQTADTKTTATAKSVASVNAFLATLSPAQQSKLMFEFNDDKQRVRWSNLPDSMAPRGGLKLGDLSEAQRKAALGLLAVVFSKKGFEKVIGIMDGDEALKVSTGGRGGMFGRDLYFISILGKPSTKDPWMLQFGGHHLALNLTIAGSEGILTPSFTAAQPAKFMRNGEMVRPLGAENDKGFALIGALDEGQRKQAILNYQVADIVLGVGQDGKRVQPEGIKGSALNARQQAMLLDLVSEWVGIVNDATAAPRTAQIQASIAETWFAWSGPTAPGSAAYFRIQGPALVIEYSPQKLGGDATQHIHTMYRDPTNDYGRKPAAR